MKSTNNEGQFLFVIKLQWHIVCGYNRVLCDISHLQEYSYLRSTSHSQEAEKLMDPDGTNEPLDCDNHYCPLIFR